MTAPLRPNAAPRRVEALAIIVDRITRSGTSPCYSEIGRAMRPTVNKSRVQQLVNQLVRLEVIDRDPGSQRGIRIRDLPACRAMIQAALGMEGWWHAEQLGALIPPTPYTSEQLPLMPPFEHIPDVD